MHTQEIVQRLWALCHVLRDDGITYHEYVTELTYLLFLKMARETETEGQLPAGHRWADLTGREGSEQLEFYRTLLVHLGSHGSPLVQACQTFLPWDLDFVRADRALFEFLQPGGGLEQWLGKDVTHGQSVRLQLGPRELALSPSFGEPGGYSNYE